MPRRSVMLWLSYEVRIANKPSVVEHVLKFYGSRIDQETIKQAIVSIESNGHKNRCN